MPYTLDYLKELESESIFVLRELTAQFERPCLLFSGGKDSILVAWLAQKAFFPARIPFPLVHIDTGHNFQEALEYRDWLVEKLGVRLLIGSVQQWIDEGRLQDETGYYASRNILQTPVLLDMLEKNGFDCAIGGARRDEEKPAPKSGFSVTATSSGNGTPKISVPNCGTSSTAGKRRASISGCSPFPTGRNWMSGNTWPRKMCPCPVSTSRIGAASSNATGCCWPTAR